MTAHFSLNAPVWSLHLITRCFKQMAREGTAAPGCFRGAPGEPIQRTSQECRAARPASAPEAEQGRGLEPRFPGEASKNLPTLLERGAQQGVRLGQQAAFCPRKLLVFLFWMVFWNRPDCICYLIQKVSVNVIHLQINFSASGWVSNKKEAPCGAQASAACGPGWVLPLTVARWPVLTTPWAAPQTGRAGGRREAVPRAALWTTEIFS